MSCVCVCVGMSCVCVCGGMSCVCVCGHVVMFMCLCESISVFTNVAITDRLPCPVGRLQRSDLCHVPGRTQDLSRSGSVGR